MEVGDIGVEAGEGVLVGEEAGVGEGPAEYWWLISRGELVWGVSWGGGDFDHYDSHLGGFGMHWIKESWYNERSLTVADEDDGFRLRPAFGFSDVGIQTTNVVDSTRGFAFVDRAA